MDVRPHGTRSRYRTGCGCLPCRVANAWYVSRYRRRRLQGLGAGRKWGVEARRLVRRLEIEGYTKARIARLAGWTDGRAYHVTFRPGQAVRWATLERLREVARDAFLEGAA